MIKKILLFTFTGFIISSCGILDTREQTEIISEKSCQETCLMKNKSYQGYDEEYGCFCGIK